MDEETKDLAFELAQVRIELEEARKVIAIAREAVAQVGNRQAFVTLRAAIALYDVVKPQPNDVQPAVQQPDAS
jgi:hypothetical protein